MTITVTMAMARMTTRHRLLFNSHQCSCDIRDQWKIPMAILSVTMARMTMRYPDPLLYNSEGKGGLQWMLPRMRNRLREPGDTFRPACKEQGARSKDAIHCYLTAMCVISE